MSEFAGNPEFTKLLERPSEIDLVQLMLELAGDAYPQVDKVGCLLEIDRLGVSCCDQVSQLCAPTARERLEAISRQLYDVEGFHGNRENYCDPENSYLNRVLERRCGIPISLGILYMAVAARTGLKMFGVNTPGHFVVGCCHAGQVWYVDAFANGDVLDRAACKCRIEQTLGQPGMVCDNDFRPATAHDIVARVLRNLKAAYAAGNCWKSVLAVQRRLLALVPDSTQERRDLGMVYLRLGQPCDALGILEPFLASVEAAGDEEFVSSLRSGVKAAKRMLIERN